MKPTSALAAALADEPVVHRPGATGRSPRIPRLPDLTELVVDFITEHPEGARAPDIVAAIGEDKTILEQVRAELVELEQLGIVWRTGNTRATKWFLG